MRCHLYYLAWTVGLFLVEVGIAVFVNDVFIRPYVGDVLVVILIYAFVRAFFKIAIVPAALGVVMFAFSVETLQYFRSVEILGLESSAIARTVIGTIFVWEDFVAYTMGTSLLLWLEKLLGPNQQEWFSLN